MRHGLLQRRLKHKSAFEVHTPYCFLRINIYTCVYTHVQTARWALASDWLYQAGLVIDIFKAHVSFFP